MSLVVILIRTHQKKKKCKKRWNFLHTTSVPNFFHTLIISLTTFWFRKIKLFHYRKCFVSRYVSAKKRNRFSLAIRYWNNKTENGGKVRLICGTDFMCINSMSNSFCLIFKRNIEASCERRSCLFDFGLANYRIVYTRVVCHENVKV